MLKYIKHVLFLAIILVVADQVYDGIAHPALGEETWHYPEAERLLNEFDGFHTHNFVGEKSYFTLSPDQQHIAFIQNVFEEYGKNWRRYWALHALNTETRTEKRLLVTGRSLSHFEWLNETTVRVYYHPVIGIRVYRDLHVEQEKTMFAEDQADSYTTFWTNDEQYTHQASNYQEAWATYHKVDWPTWRSETQVAPDKNKQLFEFSPSKNHITFIKNISEENPKDYDRYYAIQVFDVKTRQEKTIFTGSFRLSGFDWLDDDTIRVSLNAGTGVRAYRDVNIHRPEPDMYDSTKEFWTPDEEYTRKAQSYLKASGIYYGINPR